MRLLRVLSSQHLPCGCLAGIYECFDGRVVGIVDAPGAACRDARHHPGRTVAVAYPTPSGALRVAAAATMPLRPTSPTRLGKT